MKSRLTISTIDTKREVEVVQLCKVEFGFLTADVTGFGAGLVAELDVDVDVERLGGGKV